MFIERLWRPGDGRFALSVHVGSPGRPSWRLVPAALTRARAGLLFRPRKFTTPWVPFWGTSQSQGCWQPDDLMWFQISELQIQIGTLDQLGGSPQLCGFGRELATL